LVSVRLSLASRLGLGRPDRLARLAQAGHYSRPRPQPPGHQQTRRQPPGNQQARRQPPGNHNRPGRRSSRRQQTRREPTEHNRPRGQPRRRRRPRPKPRGRPELNDLNFAIRGNSPPARADIAYVRRLPAGQRGQFRSAGSERRFAAKMAWQSESVL